MTLSAREKILLFVLAIVLILFVGIRYLVLPSFKSYTADLQKLDGLMQKQQQTQNAVSQARTVGERERQALQKAESAASPLLPSADSDLLNVWAVKLMEDAGLKVTSITLAPATSVDIAPSGSGAAGTSSAVPGLPGYKLGDYAETYKGTAPKAAGGTSSAASSPSSASSSASGTSSASSSAAGGSKEGTVLNVNISASMTGTYAQASAFLDAVKNCGKTAVVTSFTCTGSGAAVTFDAVISCYAAEKLDNSDTTFAWDQPAPAGKNSLM